MRHYLSVLLLAFPTACTTSDPDLGTVNQAATYTLRESRACDVNFCILHVENDSDGDGIADDDERAAGTDPNDRSSYPRVDDLATLVSSHALPSFEIGNSMLVLLPTVDENGLPVFGGDVWLPNRRSALERAGLEVPSTINLGRGVTIARTLKDNNLSFEQLFTALGGGSPLEPARLLADSIAWIGGGVPLHPDDVHETPTFTDVKAGVSQGKIHVDASPYTQLDGSYQVTPGFRSSELTNHDGSFRQIVLETGTDHDFSSRTVLTYRKYKDNLGNDVDVKVDDTTTNSHGILTRTKITTTTKSRNGVVEPTTVNKEVTTYDPITRTHEPEPDADDGDDKSHEPEPTEEGDDKNHENENGYRDPEYTGYYPLSPQTMNAVLVSLGSKIRVVPRDNNPIDSYTFNPIGLGNKYGPIALYGEGTEDRYGMSPSFIHLPAAPADYNPYLVEQLPPRDAPPDNTCLYCFQHGRPL